MRHSPSTTAPASASFKKCRLSARQNAFPLHQVRLFNLAAPCSKMEENTAYLTVLGLAPAKPWRQRTRRGVDCAWENGVSQWTAENALDFGKCCVCLMAKDIVCDGTLIHAPIRRRASSTKVGIRPGRSWGALVVPALCLSCKHSSTGEHYRLRMPIRTRCRF